MSLTAGQQFDEDTETHTDNYIVAIEGIIGSGKSSVIRQMMVDFPEYEYILEPVDRWVYDKGVNMLRSMYDNPKDDMAIFQIYVMNTFFENVISKIAGSHKKVFIMERSLASSLKVFTKMHYRNGNISRKQYIVIKSAFYNLNSILPIPDVSIYLVCPVKMCHIRITERCRPGEQVTLDYLNELNKYSEMYMLNTQTSLNVNSNRPLAEIATDIHSLVCTRVSLLT